MNKKDIIMTTKHMNAWEQTFDAKKWIKKGHLYLEQKWESLDIKCQIGCHPSIWAHIGQYNQVGSWIGYFYESWVRTILIENPEIKIVRKVTSIQWKVAKILEEQNSWDFKRSLPDLLIEKEDGSLAFLEIKAFAPGNGPVIYEDSFSWYEKYKEFGIPTYYVFVGHPAENSQYRFNKSGSEKRKLFKELETPRNISIVPAPIIERLYYSVPANRIQDTRKEGRYFKRLRERAILEICEQYKLFAPEEIRMLEWEIQKGCN